eukprot:TRINITY_DN5460_c0_g1_i9.p2 TRINITY_DN5460_c0_g1~~TRINITY_DN5460_c0_g1_i9.p2  ORF type:complete len:127 (+),score=20.11 TRINITY_DN5460_c0_g1_i9:665-1045(+)
MGLFVTAHLGVLQMACAMNSGGRPSCGVTNDQCAGQGGDFPCTTTATTTSTTTPTTTVRVASIGEACNNGAFCDSSSWCSSDGAGALEKPVTTMPVATTHLGALQMASAMKSATTQPVPAAMQYQE